MYLLDEHCYICVDREFCIILDARRNKYLAVPRDTMERLGPVLFGWPCEPSADDHPSLDTEHSRTINDLLVKGILTTSPNRGKPVRPADIQKPLGSIFPGPSWSTFRLLHVLPRVALSLRLATRQLSHLSFASIIQSVISTRKMGTRASHVTDVSRATMLVGAFYFLWRSCYSRPNSCLLEALALLHFLAKFNFYPSWVFGVISEPFHAHCWLQDGETILNDSAVNITNYVPIMQI